VVTEQREPARFGYQSDRSYAPSPAEIDAACAEIRAGWSRIELAHRMAMKVERVETPTAVLNGQLRDL